MESDYILSVSEVNPNAHHLLVDEQHTNMRLRLPPIAYVSVWLRIIHLIYIDFTLPPVTTRALSSIARLS